MNLVRLIKVKLLKTDGKNLTHTALGYLLGERVFRIIIGLFVHALVVRYLGPKNYGVYGIALNFFMIFQPFVNYGADDMFLQDLFKKKFSASTIIASAFIYKFLCATISYLAMAAALSRTDENSEVKILILIFGLYNFFNSFTVFEIWLQSKMDFKSIGLSRFWAYLISSLLKVLVVVLGLPMIWLALIFSFEILLARLFIKGKVDEDFSLKAVSWAYIREIFLRTWPYLLTVVVVSLNQRIGILFLSYFKDLDVVGTYNVLSTFTKLFDFIPLTLLAVFIPKIVTTKENNSDRYNKKIALLYLILGSLGVGLFCIFYLISGVFVPVFYGEGFIELEKVLPYGFLALTVTHINLVKARHMLLENMSKAWLIYNLLSLILMISFQFYLIPIWSILGVVFSYIFAFVISDIIMSILDTTYRKVLKSFLKSVYSFLKYE